MKKILLVAATELEIQPFMQLLQQKAQQLNPQVYQLPNWELHLLITGVGAVQTAYRLGAYLQKQPIDAAINVGLAGSLDYQIELGTLVEVQKDQFADLGAMDSTGEFIDVFELGFEQADRPPFAQKCLLPARKSTFLNLPKMAAYTKNTVTGTAEQLLFLQKKYPNHLETMEGAAFMYVCGCEQVAEFVQVRAISNYVELRDKSRWQLAKAVKNLNNWLAGIFLPD